MWLRGRTQVRFADLGAATEQISATQVVTQAARLEQPTNKRLESDRSSLVVTVTGASQIA